MARRRSTRSSVESRPVERDDKKQHDSQAPPPAAPDARKNPAPIAFGIVGGFAALSIMVLIASWPGYRLDRHTALADEARDERRYEDAIPHLRYIVGRYPTAWARWTQLGDCYLALERPDEAIEAYERSLAQEPEQDLDARLGRAYFLRDPSDDRAFGLLQKVFDADNNDSEVNFYMALQSMHSGDLMEAGSRFRAASRDPEFRERSAPYVEQIRKTLLDD